MALLTDDQDIRNVKMWIELGGNGDYYINLKDTNSHMRLEIRIATSGGNAPKDVKLAVASLYRALSLVGLNDPNTL